MLSFLYNFVWTLVVIFFLPFISLSKKLRFSERLGLGMHVPPSEARRIWIHALSVGEVISAIPLIRAVKSRYPDIEIVFSIKTFQGMEVAKNEFKGEVMTLIPMPVDFWWSFSRLFHRICPLVLIFVEGDMWPGMLSYLHKRNVKVFLVNGRISPRTLRSYTKFRPFARSLLNKIELCLMQSDIDRERLIEIGVPSEKVINTGNIKFDRSWRSMESDERIHWLNLLNLSLENILWVAGSTHKGEEEIILDTYKRLKGYFPELILIIAPRQTESAGDVFELSLSKGLETVLKSRIRDCSVHPYDVLILDTIGELERIYGLANISFVGGSMVPVGGHNLLEPASHGCPVLFGEYIHNFFLMSELLLDAGGGWKVADEEELFLKMKILLSNHSLSKRMGLKAKEFVLKNSGAIDRIIEHIGGYIRKNA
jgi:3-deoxy-D-manno-octulosonic-acid transferase